MKQIVDIADLDCVFLTFDEPKKEEFWATVQNIVPWAVRVDGVKGSDQAHKAAADASTTERFILIDGDNIPDPEFFNQQLILDAESSNKVFRWKARNAINGLQYGNGGISCWTREFAKNMRTHENSAGDAATAVEFCFDKNYWPMHDCWSATYPNQSEFQAWRAGFREGVKMCLDRGKQLTAAEFEKKVHQRNLEYLTIWHNIGRDVDNGEWAIYGARLGTQLTMLSAWDYQTVQDFDKLAQLWKDHCTVDPAAANLTLGNQLARRLGLPIVEYDAAQSEFFKQHYRSNFYNQGIMARDR